jgi:hypothetical protein
MSLLLSFVDDLAGFSATRASSASYRAFSSLASSFRSTTLREDGHCLREARAPLADLAKPPPVRRGLHVERNVQLSFLLRKWEVKLYQRHRGGLNERMHLAILTDFRSSKAMNTIIMDERYVTYRENIIFVILNIFTREFPMNGAGVPFFYMAPPGGVRPRYDYFFHPSLSESRRLSL